MGVDMYIQLLYIHCMAYDKQMNFRIGESEKKLYYAICDKLGLNPTGYVRQMVENFVEKNEKISQEKIKKGVSCVSRQILPLLTPPLHYNDTNITIS